MSTRETPTHSPAPWEANEDGEVSANDGGQVVAVVYSADDFPCYDPEEDGDSEVFAEEMDANRRLILKAPDLLAACRALVRQCETGGIIVGIRNHVDTMKALVDHIDGGGE